MPARDVTITVLYNNNTGDPRLRAAHGLSCLIEGLSRTILFDTGGDGDILLDNMAVLGKDPKAVEMVVLSHAHWDHSGGLFAFLHKARPGIEAFIPRAVSPVFRDHAALLGAKVNVVDEPIDITEGLHSTGQMGGERLPADRREQTLVFKGEGGAVVLTGCAHPGVVDIVRRAHDIVPGAIDAVLGGFHLKDSEAAVAEQVVDGLRQMGVRRMGPSHCTGEKHMGLFRRTWGDGVIGFDVGTTFGFRMAP
ncbi:MAG: MBL fold metallo-hydrolase [Rhodospirillales bacterium]|jgi:7,8-dihydropterin-6-yl-methyl-4-(beta-D-ribofuranosyl)aminobenzene 5'-phosphate synthase|nr:MBL fold metallo-hydrolase [Rhodospirillales bacterium]